MLKHPILRTKDVPVFDQGKVGKKVRAERYDEPGEERPTEADITDPTCRHRARQFFLLIPGDQGNWSWKPGRDKLLGDKMITFLGVPKGMPEELGRAREAAGEPGAIRYGNPVLPVRQYARVIPGVNGGLFDTLAGVRIN